VDISKIKTLADLKKSKYKSKSIKEELRSNLRAMISKKQKPFEGIHGFDDTVIPDLERAILSRHNILLLGLRGQAKTKIARLLTGLLDEYIPFIKGSEINDDPLNPISLHGKNTIQENGDKTEISWLHRDQRYIEKLATPDVSIADLVGDIDPIKAASLKLPYSDQRVIHFGLIPRSHRCIFVINELPDLQARIQVSLFNMLQEEDLQIRGFTFRFPLDLQFVFTANPEDYTNRGSIVTPLKDRIESQILTHYPKTIEIAKEITKQEARIHDEQSKNVHVSELARDILEHVVMNARESELVDVNSGVSARLSISAMENLVSTAERRMLKNGEKKTSVRISDFWGIIPSITGKIELVYEGEQEGPYFVALTLLNDAIKESFKLYFPNPNQEMKKDKDIFGVVRSWFAAGNEVNLLNDDKNAAFRKKLEEVAGLDKLLASMNIFPDQDPIVKELVLHGLASFEVIGKNIIDNHILFSDPLAGMLSDFE